MKHVTLNHLQKTFNKSKDWIYLAGPFFNEVQFNWAKELANVLRQGDYRILAPVDEPFEKNDVNAEEIFNRNIEWMKQSSIILAQLDFPLLTSYELAIVNKEIWQYNPLNIPDSGTVFEMGFVYNKIPIIGYTSSWVVKLNLMLAQCLTGFCYENPVNIFEVQGINWNLIGPWKGQQT